MQHISALRIAITFTLYIFGPVFFGAACEVMYHHSRSFRRFVRHMMRVLDF